MRLGELSIQHVRGVEDRTVTFVAPGQDASGIVIVEGPNEAGKTTLRDAFVALLTFKASSKTHDVKALQTQGRDEAPTVTATFWLGGRTFTYRKQFLKRPTTELTVTGDNPVQLSGDEAHDYVTKALDDTLDRGLWQALWLTQRELVDQPKIDDARGLMRVLDTGTQHSAVGVVEHAVMDAVRAHYGTFFTEKTGQFRTDFAQRDAAYDAAMAKLDALNRELDMIAADSDERDRLDQELPRLKTALAKAEHDAAVARSKAAELGMLRGNLKLLTAELDTEKAKRDTLQQRHDSWQRLVTDAATRAERIGALAEENASYDATITALHHDLAAAEQARVDAQNVRDTTRNARANAQQDRDRKAAFVARDAVKKRRDQLVALEAERAELVAQCDTLLTADIVEELDRLHMAVDVARIRQQQTAPELTIDAHASVTVTVNGTDTAFAAGQTLKRPVTDTTRLAINDLVTVTVSGPTDDTATQLAHATRALHDACRMHQIPDVDTARQQRDTRHTLTNRIAQIDMSVTVLLQDDTRAGIEEAFAAASSTTEPPPADDLEVLEQRLNAAQAAEHDADQAYDTADRTERELRTRHDTAVTQATTVKVTLANEHAEHERVVRDLQSHTHDSTDLVGELAKANAAVADRVTACDALRAELDAAGANDIDAVATNAEAVVADLKTTFATTQRRRDDLDTSIRVRGGDGLFERREQLAADTVHLAAERDEQLHRAAVAKRLYDTLETHRALAYSQYIAPLYHEILRFGRLLYGATFDVELDDTLAINRRHVDGTWLDLGQLSAGAQEQLALISRLACARLLGDEGGVVFFDDALGHTDRQRLERLGAVLRLAAENTQLVVLTCDGQRFRHVGGAVRIQL